jgi:hypothetical protein
MFAAHAAFLQQTAQSGPQPSTVISTIWVGLLVLAVLGVIVTGFTAKRIENIHNPTYVKAFVAQFLIGWLSMAAFFMFGLFLQAPPLVAFGIAASLVPIVVYKTVFGSMWREAALIWLVVTIVQTGATYGLTVAGLVSLAAMTGS